MKISSREATALLVLLHILLPVLFVTQILPLRRENALREERIAQAGLRRETLKRSLAQGQKESEKWALTLQQLGLLERDYLLPLKERSRLRFRMEELLFRAGVSPLRENVSLEKGANYSLLRLSFETTVDENLLQLLTVVREAPFLVYAERVNLKNGGASPTNVVLCGVMKR
ncbi:MAG TPA: hypothetical protein PKW96_07785 [Candidatus Aminicenantes bacterium]|nr:hypothetical protein [Candidatus Aminicenantes bacterium]HPT00428.1 hypothetical protein [Candidatus Aminicenantes bacterium]